MQEQYKYTIWGLTRIVTGIIAGIVVGFLFTSVLKLFFDFINLDELL